MKFRKAILLVLAIVSCVVFCGCYMGPRIEPQTVTKIIDRAEYPAKMMLKLKADSVGRPLALSYEKFLSLHAEGRTFLVDENLKDRDVFFEQWGRTSKSICGAVDTSNRLAVEIRSIYETALRYHVIEDYDTYFKYSDSAHYQERKDAPYEEILEFLNALNARKTIGDSSVSPRYFVVDSVVYYYVAAANTLESLREFSLNHRRDGGAQKTSVACVERNPMGQEALVLTPEYKEMMDDFMGYDKKDEHWYDYSLKQKFLYPEISVESQYWGHGFHYMSFPMIESVFFNENFSLAVLYMALDRGFGGYYALEKRDGVWYVVKTGVSWMS